mmetsp:Transcript_44549/g.110409  ORF Transcript_44549/g.110409 Transcript_44549/m.110409 type:complete len:200 (-) Transcript_44549:426-1025(-)
MRKCGCCSMSATLSTCSSSVSPPSASSSSLLTPMSTSPPAPPRSPACCCSGLEVLDFLPLPTGEAAPPPATAEAVAVPAAATVARHFSGAKHSHSGCAGAAPIVCAAAKPVAVAAIGMPSVMGPLTSAPMTTATRFLLVRLRLRLPSAPGAPPSMADLGDCERPRGAAVAAPARLAWKSATSVWSRMFSGGSQVFCEWS